MDRFKFWLGSALGYWIIRAIGATLRWRVEGLENYLQVAAPAGGAIMAFWHGRIFLATYYFRSRGITVMTSRNRDGEYIARVIERFGYRAARGSSSHGGRGALVEMVRELRAGRDLGFAIDGPRGPRYVAKSGAIWVAAKTARPVCAFHLSAERKWVLKSWDLFQIPVPFSSVLLRMAPPIFVPADANDVVLDQYQAKLQATLDQLLRTEDSCRGKDMR